MAVSLQTRRRRRRGSGIYDSGAVYVDGLGNPSTTGARTAAALCCVHLACKYRTVFHSAESRSQLSHITHTHAHKHVRNFLIIASRSYWGNILYSNKGQLKMLKIVYLDRHVTTVTWLWIVLGLYLQVYTSIQVSSSLSYLLSRGVFLVVVPTRTTYTSQLLFNKITTIITIRATWNYYLLLIISKYINK